MKMKLIGFAALVLGFTLVLSSCDGSAGLEKGTVVAGRDALDELQKDSTNAGKRVAVEGYLHIGSRVMHVKRGEPTTITLCSEPAGEGKTIGSVQLKFQGGKNSFSVPSQFDDTNITFTDNDGNKHDYDEKALYSFTLVREPNKKFNSDTREWEETGTYHYEYMDIRIDPIVEGAPAAAEGEKTEK